MLAWTIFLLTLLNTSSEGAPVPRNEWILLDFTTAIPWLPVNDDVMGGVSRSRFERSGDGHVFAGDLSLENNGGFASVRFPVDLRGSTGFDRFVLRVRGDGRSYQLRLRTDRRFDGVAYRATFDTVADEWHEIDVPTLAFEPTFRGRTVAGAPPLDTGQIQQIGLMIADEQAGPFRLEIAWIKAATEVAP